MKKTKKVVPDLSGAFPSDSGIDVYYDMTKYISEEHAKKIKSFLPETQMFYLRCKDLDLNQEYSVAGFETKFKGIDLLQMMDIVMREKKDPTNGLVVKGGLYFDKSNKVVGYISATGPVLME
ncbi:MAG: hypothetical protein WC998_04810 [Candidatus Paceibacterota bacterium]|jgi:hypothetical protein